MQTAALSSAQPLRLSDSFTPQVQCINFLVYFQIVRIFARNLHLLVSHSDESSKMKRSDFSKYPNRLAQTVAVFALFPVLSHAGLLSMSACAEASGALSQAVTLTQCQQVSTPNNGAAAAQDALYLSPRGGWNTAQAAVAGSGWLSGATDSAGGGQASNAFSTQYIWDILNNTGVTQHYYLNFSLFGGNVSVYGLASGARLGSEISVSVTDHFGNSLFGWGASATLDTTGAVSASASSAQIVSTSQTGAGLANVQWTAQPVRLDLGLVAPNASLGLSYVVRGNSFVDNPSGCRYSPPNMASDRPMGEQSKAAAVGETLPVCGEARTRFGDPAEIGITYSMISSVADASGNTVPLPHPFALMIVALIAIAALTKSSLKKRTCTSGEAPAAQI
jgi:hypothetical protein